MAKCVILLGGPSRATRFRPLSLDVPKPLFPLAGVPLLGHHLEASRKIPNLKEILLIGFFPADSLRDYLAKVQQTFSHVPIRYLNETQALGTAGGLYKFRKEILEGNPLQIVILHHDILCAFPLAEFAAFHTSHGKQISILGKRINEAEASHFGCLVEDPKSHQVLHFAEKPETFVSDLASCGVYIFSPSVFTSLEEIALKFSAKERTASGEVIISLERDLFTDVVLRNEMFLFQTSDFFIQIKLAGEITRCQEVVLREYRKTNSPLLAKNGDGKSAPTIVGDVVIDPTASVHPSAKKIGPNVEIGANVKIGAGVRVKHSLVLDNAEVKAGNIGITIFGRDVSTAAEVIVRSSVVLPHKSLSENHHNEILL